ncbi:hypothetical protein CCH79_00005097 [Gambusia affinis]|uniref:Mitochondrial import inner membrane translocase subunit TIM50 n=1 Tax=Gambusia affinis TaxID=33528 RepID=A0A315VPH7_GAMAF|nr:hypothetical protein CCH79_00005097 [Gambusia affinis]
MDHMSIITQVSNPKEEEIISFNQEKGKENSSKGTSQSNSSLKKQRSRSIFSTIFCCFRNYNVEPPATNSTLPPPVEENGSPPKCDQVEVIPVPSPPAKYLLPEMKISDYGRKCVVIDLDETLVHSSFKPISNADFIVPVEIDGTVHQVYVLKRPHVDEFLQKMGELFECVLFTASFNPSWNENFKFDVHVPELALLRFLIEDHDSASDNEFVGQYTLPFNSLKMGTF